MLDAHILQARDLCVVTKINALERVSLLLHVVCSASASVCVDIALSVRAEEDLSRE